MALSNWDLLAFDSEGKPSDGVFQYKDTEVQIYKNWLYLRNKNMWQNDNGFSKPTISEIQNGKINICGIKINAERYDEQEAVFCYISHLDYKDKSKNQFMCGIGCYGFMSTLEWLKISHPEVLEKVPPEFRDKKCMSSSEYSHGKDWLEYLTFFGEDYKLLFKLEVPEPSLEDLWVGVKKETVEAFYEWLKTVADEDYLKKIDINQALRFNQGDAYFADTVEGFDLKPTKVGEKTKPIIADLLGN